MFKTPLTISLIFITMMICFCFFAWFNLPELPSYPVHWNASGQVDRFSHKTEVLFILFVLPISSMLMTLIFYVMPKIEPLRQDLLNSHRAYSLIWIAMILLFTVISGFIAVQYIDLPIDRANDQAITTSPQTSALNIENITLAISVFFIFIGNLMGKIRQNFTLGIRTPWTLSSDLSWEKTHRLMGRLMVMAGIIGVICAFITPAAISLFVITGLILAICAYGVVYSYQVWKTDPKKHQ